LPGSVTSPTKTLCLLPFRSVKKSTTPPFSGAKAKTTALFSYDNVQKLHFKAYIAMICLRKQPYLLYIFNAISSILKRIYISIEIL
jgi:hypothetical protein